MALEDYKVIQLTKRRKLLEGGEQIYTSSKRTHTNAEALASFASLKKSGKEITLAGRVMSLRRHGGIMFGTTKDESGLFQFFVARDRIGDAAYESFVENTDVGDIIEVRGSLFQTRSKEKTIEVSSARLLTKALRPLPEKWHGLSDVEERFRKRYLDTLMNDEVHANVFLRAKILEAIRKGLTDEGFVEVETPILQTLPGGASAKPFKTHLNALDLDLYLRVSPELFLKRLLVGGFEKVFEMGRCFRNEGIDYSHNPEFSELEFYWAYQDYKGLMKFTEKFLGNVMKASGKGLKISYAGKEINFKTPWPRIEFTTLLHKYAGIDYESMNGQAMLHKAKELGVETQKNMSKAHVAEAIYKKYCLPQITDPVFIIHHPVELAPLAKPLEENPAYAARFQLLCAGWELVNAFSELNDPVIQRQRLEEQERQRKGGNEEAQRLDEDFLEALEYGMPPAAGFGMGIDRFIALLCDAHTLREVILFPTMKPKK